MKKQDKNFLGLENKILSGKKSFLPALALSTGLTVIGIYTSYLGYDVNNNDLSFLGMTLLLPGLIGLGGLINNLRGYTK